MCHYCTVYGTNGFFFHSIRIAPSLDADIVKRGEMLCSDGKKKLSTRLTRPGCVLERDEKHIAKYIFFWCTFFHYFPLSLPREGRDWGTAGGGRGALKNILCCDGTRKFPSQGYRTSYRTECYIMLGRDARGLAEVCGGFEGISEKGKWALRWGVRKKKCVAAVN